MSSRLQTLKFLAKWVAEGKGHEMERFKESGSGSHYSFCKKCRRALKVDKSLVFSTGPAKNTKCPGAPK